MLCLRTPANSWMRSPAPQGSSCIRPTTRLFGGRSKLCLCAPHCSRANCCTAATTQQTRAMAAATGCLPGGQRHCCWRSSASTTAALHSTPRTPSRIGCAKQPSHLWVAGAPCANANTHHAHHPGAAAAAAAGAAAGAPAGTERTSRAAMPALGESLLLRCDRIGSGGMGVCLVGDSRLVVLVRGALPGELLQATVTALHKGASALSFGGQGV
jgi:hypothetical protein